MKIARTTDIEYIKKCITHPRLWEHLTDDGSVKKNQYEPPVADSIYWLMPIEEGIPYGVFLLHPHNYVCYEVHTCLLPEIWGRTTECTAAVIKWVFTNTPCQRIITNVPEYNVLALRLAEESGLTKFGVNTKSYLKGGILFDQIMLGRSKENGLCQ